MQELIAVDRKDFTEYNERKNLNIYFFPYWGSFVVFTIHFLLLYDSFDIGVL